MGPFILLGNNSKICFYAVGHLVGWLTYFIAKFQDILHVVLRNEMYV